MRNGLTNRPTVVILPDIFAEIGWDYFVIVFFVNSERKDFDAELLNDVPDSEKNFFLLPITPVCKFSFRISGHKYRSMEVAEMFLGLERSPVSFQCLYWLSRDDDSRRVS